MDVLVFPEVVGFCADEQAETPCCDAEEDFVACAVEGLGFVLVDLQYHHVSVKGCGRGRGGVGGGKGSNKPELR